MAKIIYEPSGKAKEYCDLAVNLYKGCSHACKYCYAPSATFTSREDFNNHQEPRKNIIEKLRVDAQNNQGNGDHVLLSFTSDAYQHLDQELQLTRQAIKILKENGYNIVILSKAGKRAERDFDLLDNNDFVGTTLTCDNEKDSLKWEPRAAIPKERIEMIKKAKNKGFGTWVSLEPVIYPEQSLNLIDITKDFVDLFKVGKLNYNKKANEINWTDFAHDAIDKLKRYDKQYYIKKDLREYL